MKDYRYILFDLDGTLTDSGKGIVNSVAYSLEKCKIPVGDHEQLYRFVGPPLVHSYMNFYGFSHEEAVRMVDIYREYYAVKGLFENDVYPGIEALLKKLHQSGKILIVATSKPEEYARQIMEHFGLDRYFTYIAGSNMDETRSKKAEVIQYALDTCRIREKEKVIMIGDREHDVYGAREIGIDCIGVLYGYGDRNELEEAGAAGIAETVSELTEILLEARKDIEK